MRLRLLITRLCANYILFHALYIDIVVEVDNVFLLSVEAIDLHINGGTISIAPEYVCILSDDVIEGDLDIVLDFAYTVDSAHHQLVQVSVN